MNKIFKFKKIANANKKAIQMKKAYGYKPTVFKATNNRTGKYNYVVVKPKGLKRI